MVSIITERFPDGRTARFIFDLKKETVTTELNGRVTARDASVAGYIGYIIDNKERMENT